MNSAANTAAKTVRTPDVGDDTKRCLSATGSSRRAHLVGARGAGMKALGELLHDLGWPLTGSDSSESIDSQHDIPLFPIITGQMATNLPADTELLIYSPAIAAENPEREAARARGIPEVCSIDVLAELMRGRVGICVAGTHGKTTTTAMVASILRKSGLSPSASVGGELVQYHRSGWAGAGRNLVVESCEYRRHFLEFSPTFAAILNVEPDHFDCFPTFDEARSAYGAFAALVASGGLLVTRGDDEVARETAAHSAARVETFSFNPTSDWSAADVHKESSRTRFQILRAGLHIGEVTLQVPGEHQVLNALAASALAFAAGAAARDICTALSEFRGVRRRFEILGAWRGAIVIDDYAHHPTAVQATIRAARQCFGNRRLICVFQPHQVSRTLHLMSEFADCFVGADLLLLAPIYAARERVDLAEAALCELTSRVVGTGIAVQSMTSLDQLRASLDHAIRPDDVLLIMGAGDINRIGYELTRDIQRDYSG